MIEPEVVEELRRQLEIWAGAYRNLESLNEKIIALDVERAALQTQYEGELNIRQEASDTVNALVSDIEETPENRAVVSKLLNECVASVIVEGFVQ